MEEVRVRYKMRVVHMRARVWYKLNVLWRRRVGYKVRVLW